MLNIYIKELWNTCKNIRKDFRIFHTSSISVNIYIYSLFINVNIYMGKEAAMFLLGFARLD